MCTTKFKVLQYCCWQVGNKIMFNVHEQLLESYHRLTVENTSLHWLNQFSSAVHFFFRLQHWRWELACMLCHRLARLTLSTAHSHLNSKIANILTRIASNKRIATDRTGRSNSIAQHTKKKTIRHMARVSTGEGDCLLNSKRKMTMHANADAIHIEHVCDEAVEGTSTNASMCLKFSAISKTFSVGDDDLTRNSSAV